MDRLETRELAYFVAVAEELHFGRAAERLGIAQPPLSRAISRLERRMGVRLLERTSRRVALTDAGAVFLDESRRLLDSLDAAVRRTRRVPQPGRLVMAVRPGTASGLIAELLRSSEVGGHDIVFTHDRPAALRDGRADIALLCVGSDDLTGLRTADLAEEAPFALVPRDHPLTRRPAVTVAELGRDPHYARECPPVGLDEIIDRVALGRLVTVVGSGAAERISPEVTAVPVSDLPPTRLALAWPEGASRPAVAAFVRTARAAEARRTLDARDARDARDRAGADLR
ncbi:LysR family transcriptional regulator [Streptomyces sp. NPDC050548]|uniref:LysR family transcriptional regulator n=1 Tax=Streptomyces sp. NPDC050548 TaxID=3365629 RepID=UPI0037917F8E